MISGKVITFYSYKGGTGRSMALANVACILARGRSGLDDILVMDWDLEAPGLHRFLPAHAPDGPEYKAFYTGQPGLIDLIFELDERSKQFGSIVNSEELAAKLLLSIDLDQFIADTQVPRIRLMTAGALDEGYSQRAAEFSWPQFYLHAPALLPALMDQLTRRYAYVLIDSRTGEGDVSGVCTMILPEKVVAVFTPNLQSVLGVLENSRKALEYRKASPDLRPLSIFPLPSRIEMAEPELREEWRFGRKDRQFSGYQPLFESLFREAYDLPRCDLQGYFDEVQVQHVPRYAYGEDIAVLVEKQTDRLSLARSYEAFAQRLEQLPVPWESLSESRLGKDSVPETETEIERSFRESAELYHQLGDPKVEALTLAALAEYQYSKRSPEIARATYEEATQAAGSTEARIGVLLRWGNLLLTYDPLEAASVFTRAYQEATGEHLEGNLLFKRGQAYLKLLRPIQAIEDFRRAREKLLLSGAPEDGLLEVDMHLAKSLIESGDLQAAEPILEAIMQHPLLHERHHRMAEALAIQATAKLRRKDYAAATQAVTAAAELYGDRRPLEFLLLQARLAKAEEDLDAAEALLAQVIDASRTSGDKAIRAGALREIAEVRAHRAKHV